MESEEADKKKAKEPPSKPNVAEKPLIGNRAKQTNSIKENIKAINKEVDDMVKAKNTRGAVK